MKTKHVKAALSAMVVKTDRNDARGIAQTPRHETCQVRLCTQAGDNPVSHVGRACITCGSRKLTFAGEKTRPQQCRQNRRRSFEQDRNQPSYPRPAAGTKEPSKAASPLVTALVANSRALDWFLGSYLSRIMWWRLCRQRTEARARRRDIIWRI